MHILSYLPLHSVLKVLKQLQADYRYQSQVDLILCEALLTYPTPDSADPVYIDPVHAAGAAGAIGAIGAAGAIGAVDPVATLLHDIQQHTRKERWMVLDLLTRRLTNEFVKVFTYYKTHHPQCRLDPALIQYSIRQADRRSAEECEKAAYELLEIYEFLKLYENLENIDAR